MSEVSLPDRCPQNIPRIDVRRDVHWHPSTTALSAGFRDQGCTRLARGHDFRRSPQGSV